MNAINICEVFIFDDGRQGYLVIMTKDGVRPLNDSEKTGEQLMELDEYNRQNH